MPIDTALAVYGSLAPGRPNAHQLAALDGRWLPGTVRGRLVDSGWGVALGYLGRVGLGLMSAIATPHDHANASRRGIPQCHRRAVVPFSEAPRTRCAGIA